MDGRRAARGPTRSVRLRGVLLPTAVVGSYPQPDWLIDRAALGTRLPPRVRARELWRIPPERLEEAQDDATVVAIGEMESAGIDIITDGEVRRESYSNRFATALGGIDPEHHGTAMDRTGKPNPVPRIVGPITRPEPIGVRDLEFLRAHSTRTIKITLPGPFTLIQQVQDDHYGDERKAASAYAKAVNREIKDLFDAGADVVQLDEPYMQARSDKAAQYAVEVLDEALDGVAGTTALHMCFGYAAIHAWRGLGKPDAYAFLPELNVSAVDQISIEAAQPGIDLDILSKLPDKTVVLGVIDNGDATVETPETVAQRIRDALQHTSPDRLIPAPDCGMKYLPREVAFAKLSALAAGAAIVRAELGA